MADRPDNLGTMVLGPVTFEITQVRLIRGGLEVVALAPGPHPAVSGYPTIFAADGAGVCQASDYTEVGPIGSGYWSRILWRANIKFVTSAPH